MAVIVIIAGLLGLSVYSLRDKNLPKSLQYLTTLSVFVFCIFTVAYLAADYFTGEGIDESVIYHLQYGLEGAGFVEYLGIISLAAALILASIALAAITYRSLTLDDSQPPSKLKWLPLVLPLLIAAHPFSTNLLAIYNFDILNLLNFSVSEEQARKDELIKFSFDRYYQLPTVPQAQASSPNVVFIYLESFERTYFDPTLFPGLADELKALEQQSLSFHNIKQVAKTNWTIAGMTASQCGIPLIVAANGNNAMSGMDKFLPGATCIGDILKQRNYALSFMGGASLDFAGKGKFYRSHGFASVKGRDELSAGLHDPDYISSWGLYDDTLLAQTYLEFERLSESGEHFGLFALTMDTHHPKGHQSKACKEIAYQDGTNPILNAVHCSNLMVADFINKIRNSPYAQNTVIVIASDHLAMRNTSHEILQQGDRKNLLMIFHPSRIAAGTSTKAGSTLDIAPTVLSVMGFDTEALGFGRSLLLAKPTLVESSAEHNWLLHFWQKDLEKFWNLPSAAQGIEIDPLSSLVRIQEREFAVPLLLTFDQAAEVSTMVFEQYSKVKLIDHVLLSDPNELVSWIDHCEKVRALDLSLPEAGYCIFAGKLGSRQSLTQPIEQPFMLSHTELLELAGSNISSPLAKARKLSVALTISDGQAGIDTYTVPLASGLHTAVTIRSAGGVVKASDVRVNDKRLTLKRGLHLLGLNGDAMPEAISHIDLCAKPERPIVAGEFRDIMSATADRFETFIIVSHDSSICRGASLAAVFDSLPLSKWQDIGMRVPYIAVIPRAPAQALEFVSTGNHQIILNLVVDELDDHSES